MFLCACADAISDADSFFLFNLRVSLCWDANERGGRRRTRRVFVAWRCPGIDGGRSPAGDMYKFRASSQGKAEEWVKQLHDAAVGLRPQPLPANLISFE